MSVSISSISQGAYEQVSDDTKFVRLTTVTTIIHSIAFLLYIGYTVGMILSESNAATINLSSIFSSITHAISGGKYGFLIAIGAIVLFIGYYLMPAIGEGALIHYLADENKKGTRSIGKGFGSFFPMFEFSGMMTFFTPVMFVVFLSRFRILGILNNIFIIIFLSLRALLVFFASVFLPFTKYFIVLEGLKPLDAMKKSMSISLAHLGLAIRATLLQYMLSMRFIINILLFLGVPLLIVYTATKFDISQTSGALFTIVITISVLMGLLIAYVNGIIEAFFITLRYRLFEQIKG